MNLNERMAQNEKMNPNKKMKQDERRTESAKSKIMPVWKRAIAVELAFLLSVASLAGGAGISFTDAAVPKITAEQADKMALALTDKIWVWDWVAFFVPYMTEDGVKQLVPASKKSEWAGSVDYTTGKKIKFTKKQVNAARKEKPKKKLTQKDIDSHAYMIMESNGDWDCVSFMFPYMSNKGIRKVVRCYNKKHGGNEKKAADYYH